MTDTSIISDQTSVPVWVATLLRDEHGDTGVHSHFNAFRDYMTQQGSELKILTPFDAQWWLVYPLFGARRLIDPVSGALSVWWYRYWHYVLLRRVLRGVLRDGVACVIYAQCPLSARAALEARMNGQQRVVMIAHFNVSQADEWVAKSRISPTGRMYRAILKTEARILPRLDGLVSVSHFMLARLHERIPALARVACTVIPNFVSLPEAEVEKVPPADLINIGTLEARKNQQYLLQVLHHARQLGRRYTLNLVGDGPDRAMLESLAEGYGLLDQVRFLGARRDAARLLRQHRVYVHSATMESFGIVLIEAMACGLPVFAAPVGGIPEVFDEGAEGCYWPLNNPAQAAAILIAVLEHPRQLTAMAEAAGRRYRQCYTPEVAAARLRHFLQDGLRA